ncbi:MAG: DNA alkylation repair protein [Candidatus Metalachnospira sp.]|nr:DNA alkylation repair protein [Candidatus Metalachnospira sp.]
MNKEDLQEVLVKLSDEKYRDFHMKLQPTQSKVLGVRMGELRKTAKNLAKEDWKEYVINLGENDSYEEKVIAGMSIFYSKAEIKEKIEYCKSMMPFIDGWAICDSICTTIKLKPVEYSAFWEYAFMCTASSEEFMARFGFVSMLHLFIDSEHINEIINQIDTKNFAGYYDSMAAAWLLADCMVKFPDLVFEYMENNHMSDWLHNKAISKMRESYRVSDEMKAELNKLIRKNLKS